MTRAARTPRAAAGEQANPRSAGLVEVGAILREMLRIPAEIALRVAERLGLVVLAAWRFVFPLLLAALALARRGSAFPRGRHPGPGDRRRRPWQPGSSPPPSSSTTATSRPAFRTTRDPTTSPRRR